MMPYCDVGIIFNTRMTGGVVWIEGRGEDNIDTMWVLFLIPAREHGEVC